MRTLEMKGLFYTIDNGTLTTRHRRYIIKGFVTSPRYSDLILEPKNSFTDTLARAGELVGTASPQGVITRARKKQLAGQAAPARIRDG